jgi:hypothetical protein
MNFQTAMGLFFWNGGSIKHTLIFNLTSESFAKIADFTFVENAKQIITENSVSQPVCR